MAGEQQNHYSDSGAAEALREEITEMVKNDWCLNEDNASEIEMMRMDEVPLPELLNEIKNFWLLQNSEQLVHGEPDEEDEEENVASAKQPEPKI